MSHALSGTGKLSSFLFQLDHDLAGQARARGCSCGGRLHQAHYPRKPRGISPEAKREWKMRLSFCCGREGCRKRLTPPSVRFLGRVVYAGFVVVLISALKHGATPRRLRQLKALLGVDRRTLARWRDWWRESFPRTAWWLGACGRFLPCLDPSDLPRSLLARFAGRGAERLASLLKFLAPLSTSSAPPDLAF